MTDISMLYGRDTEQQLLDRLVRRAGTGHSGALVLHGAPGIGKSALLDYAAAHAGGLRVLRCTGTESEAELAFAGLHWLLRPAIGVLDGLAAPQAQALRCAFGMGPATGADRFLVGLAVLSLLAEYAAAQPVLCLIDDAHWLDGASLEALLFAARRLDAEGVVMVFAQREEYPVPAGLAELALSGLTSAASARLLHDTVPNLTEHQRVRVLSEADGNPLALRELPGSLSATTALGTLPLPGRIQDAYQRRIAMLPEPVRGLLVVAAAEGTGDFGATLRAVERLGITPDAADIAERAGLITVAGHALTFRHPLIRTAAYQGAPSGERRAAHRALAEVLTASDEADRRAWHRAEATPGPDEDIAAELESTALRARQRRGFASAAVALERAALLSEVPGARVTRLTLAAESALEAGLRARAGELTERAQQLAEDPRASGQLALLRARIAVGDGALRAAHRLLIASSVRVCGLDPDLNMAILVDAIKVAWFVGDLDMLRATAERIRSGPWPGPEYEVRGHGVLALEHLAAGRQAQAQPSIAAFVEFGRRADTPLDMRGNAAGLALLNGDFAAARDISHVAVADLRVAGMIGKLPAMLQVQALADTFENHFADAVAACVEGVRLERDTGQSYHVAHLRAAQALALAYLGEASRCRELAEQTLVYLAAEGAVNAATVAHWALAVLDLSRGRYEAVVDRLEANAEGPARHQMDVIYSAPDQIEAAVRLGRPDRAQLPLARFTHWTEAVDRRWAHALHSRCLALTSGDDNAEQHFRAALALHTGSGRPFEYARTELLYAEWLRRNRRATDARVYLRTAVDRFQRTGATLWADRARAELRAAGETPQSTAPAESRLDLLTAQELQVVRLASQGLTNRDIAAQLFISPRTVSHHLYRAFPKLGVTSRVELARLRLAQ